MSNEVIKKYALSNVPYLFILWIFDKLGAAYRIAAGTDLGTKLIGMLESVNTVFASPLPEMNPFDLMVGIAGTVAVYVIVYFKKKNAKKFRKDVEYGSARWSA